MIIINRSSGSFMQVKEKSCLWWSHEVSLCIFIAHRNIKAGVIYKDYSFTCLSVNVTSYEEHNIQTSSHSFNCSVYCRCVVVPNGERPAETPTLIGEHGTESVSLFSSTDDVSDRRVRRGGMWPSDTVRTLGEPQCSSHPRRTVWADCWLHNTTQHRKTSTTKPTLCTTPVQQI